MGRQQDRKEPRYDKSIGVHTVDAGEARGHSTISTNSKRTMHCKEVAKHTERLGSSTKHTACDCLTTFTRDVLVILGCSA